MLLNSPIALPPLSTCFPVVSPTPLILASPAPPNSPRNVSTRSRSSTLRCPVFPLPPWLPLMQLPAVHPLRYVDRPLFLGLTMLIIMTSSTVARPLMLPNSLIVLPLLSACFQVVSPTPLIPASPAPPNFPRNVSTRSRSSILHCLAFPLPPLQLPPLQPQLPPLQLPAVQLLRCVDRALFLA